MDSATWYKHRLVNTLQSVVLLAAMAALMSALGWVIGGGAGVLFALATGALMIVLSPSVSPALLLRMYRARRILPREAPSLYEMSSVLARRAGVPQPGLYYLPSGMINAFAVGSRDSAAIAVSDGLLRALSQREIFGVLAHEMSHVRHNDMRVMGLADLFSRLTSLLSSFGQILLVINLPLLLFSEYTISWMTILLLVFAPTLSALIQLALSRTREYDADVGAAELLGDPRGLALALDKMSRIQGRMFEQIFLPGRHLPEPSLLRTHPPTEERIKRLRELEPKSPRPPMQPPPRPLRPIAPHAPRPPRWHLGGLWY